MKVKTIRVYEGEDFEIMKDLQTMSLDDPILQSCLHVFQNCDIKKILINCVRALKERNKELQKFNLDQMTYRAKPCQILMPFKKEEVEAFLGSPPTPPESRDIDHNGPA